jgi:hypothetical protein
VRFTVEPAGGVADGTVVDAQASIVFDVNEPIVTNTWTNTFDLTPPTSAVTGPESPSATNALAFDLGGFDDVSGVAGWRIEVATGDAELVTVGGRREDPAFALTAPRGQRVRVRARAVDGAGNLDPRRRGRRGRGRRGRGGAGGRRRPDRRSRPLRDRGRRRRRGGSRRRRRSGDDVARDRAELP